MTLAYERASAEPRIELDLTHNHDGAHDDEQSASSDRNGAVSLMAGSPLATEVYALLPRASAKIAHICAEMLTSSGHMTQSLAFAFLARGDRSSLIALAGAQTLPSTLLLQRASAGTPEEARAIASRADLDPLILATLCDRLDPVIDYLIAESPALADAFRVVDHLILRAKKDMKLAAYLLERDDLSFHQRARLFEKASATQRTLLLKEAIAEAQTAYVPNKNRRAIPVSLTNALDSGYREEALSALTACCGMRSTLSLYRPRFDQPDGAMVTLAALALGMDKKDIHRLLELIGVDPIMKLRPGGAVDLLEQLTDASAKLLLDAINAPYHQRYSKAGKDQSDHFHASFPLEMDAVA